MARSRNSWLPVSVGMLAALTLLPAGGATHAETQIARAVDFATATVRFEQNATDGDVEVVFEAKGDNNGLERFKVVAPDGRIVVDFSAPDASTLGIRQFRMESPEPKDVRALKTAYPEGRYRFSGMTSAGVRLTGQSALSHELPATVRFETPAPNATGVATGNVKISWVRVPGVARYIVEIEQDELGTRVVATLSGHAASFAVPEGFLVPGTEYKLGIGTVSEAGNISFVETTFTTGK